MADVPVINANVHHEILVYDAVEAAEFMEDVLGATRVEIEFGEMVEAGWDVTNRHMFVGGRVYQLLSPVHDVPSTPSPLRNWYDRSLLPGIHNITFSVNDAEALAQKMRNLGVASLGEMHPPGAPPEAPPVYMYDAREQCGIIFEFVQAPTDGTPGWAPPDPLPPNPWNIQNIHLEVLVRDPVEAEKFLEDVFGAERTEQEFAYQVEEGWDLRNRHVKMAGEIYQLLTPNHDVPNTPSFLRNWYDRPILPSVHNVTFSVNDAKAFAAKLRSRGVRSMGEARVQTPDPDNPATVYMYDATQQCGLRFEFVQEFDAPPPQ
jgi:catechol 2,3-dioxygenase-like lactoylglutathione lyase family enzyme